MYNVSASIFIHEGVSLLDTPKATFRLEPKILKLMDKLIADPPSVLFDGNRGAARNRAELIRVLVMKAAELQAKEKSK